MYNTLNSISAVLFVLSFVSGAAAVYMYRVFDIQGYRKMLANSRVDPGKKHVKRKNKRQEDSRKHNRDVAAVQKEEPRKAEVSEKGSAEPVPEDRKKTDAAPSVSGKFVVRTVSESDAARRSVPSEKDDEDGSSVTEKLNMKKEPAGSGFRADAPDDTDHRQDGAETMDEDRETAAETGSASLQDGSDDTTYLKKPTGGDRQKKETEPVFWLRPGSWFRPAASTMIIHADRTISQLMQEQKEEQ